MFVKTVSFKYLKYMYGLVFNPLFTISNNQPKIVWDVPRINIKHMTIDNRPGITAWLRTLVPYDMLIAEQLLWGFKKVFLIWCTRKYPDLFCQKLRYVSWEVKWAHFNHDPKISQLWTKSNIFTSRHPIYC